MAMSVTYANFCGRIVAENRGGTVKTYGRDTLGNTVALRDIHQNTTDTWEYWPYGEVATRTGTTPTPFQFGGTLGYYMFYMQVIALAYVRARILMTMFGIWISVDPVWPVQHPYAYSGSSPKTYSDPSGLSPGCNFWRCMNNPNLVTIAPRQRCAYCNNTYDAHINCGIFPKLSGPNGSGWSKKILPIISILPGGGEGLTSPNFSYKSCEALCFLANQMSRDIINRAKLKKTCIAACNALGQSGCDGLAARCGLYGDTVQGDICEIFWKFNCVDKVP